MHIRRSGVIRATVLLLAGAGLTTSVFAAEIEEVTVTARKRSENLQDIPMVITAISAEAIQRKGISDLADIAKYSSGVMLDEGFNKQDTRVVIRGLSPTRGRQNVAILLDDVDISSLAQATAGGSFVINPRLMDVERIEIVKGPHSALFGRSAFNGAIHYITKKPGDEFAANAQLDVGTYSKFEGRGNISGSLIQDKLTGGLNVAAWGSDGFYKSSVTGHSLGGGSGWGAAVALRFTPTDNLSFNLRTEVSEDRYEPEAATVKRPSLVALPSAVLVAANGLPAVVGAAVAANPANAFFPQTFGSLGNARDFPNPAPSRNPRTGTDYPGSNRDIARTILRGDWDFGPVVLSSISGYGDNKTLQFNDALAVGDFADPLVNGGQETYFDTRIKTISEEIRLQSKSEGRFNWTVGGLYWTEELEQINRALRCTSAGGDCARVFQSVGTAARTPEDFTRRNTYHSSAYGLVDFKITDTLSIGAEIRNTKEKENTQAQGVVGPPSSIGCPSVTTNGRIFGANGVVSCSANPTGTASVNPQTAAQLLATLTSSTPRYAQVKSSFNTPRFSLDYKFAPGKMAYLSYAEGKKPGGLSPLTGIANLAANTYLPEELAAYEIGAKTSWLDNRLQLNAAIYYQDYSKKQVSITFVDPVTNQLTTQVVNAASASVKGFELELNAAPTDNWTLSAGYTFNNGKYEDFTDIQAGVSAISRAIVNNPSACTVIVVSGSNRCAINYSGNRLEGAPKHSLVMGTEVRGNWRDGMDWFFNLDSRYQSDRFTSFENSLVMEAYWMTDIRVGLKSGKKWTLTAYINNLFDDDTMKASAVYIQDWNLAFAAGAAGTVRTPISAQAPSGARAVLPDRRQLGLRASFNF
jgi:iron complex outermembrane receptor protein